MPHEQPWLDTQTKEFHKSTVVEEFFDSSIYKDILARNDKKGEFVVQTASDSIFYLKESTLTVLELHFPEEIESAIAQVNS